MFRVTRRLTALLALTLFAAHSAAAISACSGEKLARLFDFASDCPNALGEATQVGSYASGVGYHPNGAISSLTYGNGRVYTTTQNARRLPEDLKVLAGSTAIVSLRHQYDANANLTGITDFVTSGATRAMSYDGLDRLQTASGLWGAGSYSYDALGNLKSQSEGGQATTYTYNTALNRLTGLSGAHPASFSYDARGNVTGNGSQGFTYNLAGSLVSSTLPAVTYAYDGHGRRVKQTEGGQTRYSVYSQAGTLLHQSAGGLATDYIHAGSLLVAEKSGATIDYLHTDLLGSPVAGHNGSSYSEYYTPWGDKWSHPIQLAGEVGYTGHPNDLATGLTYMQARYYDPLVGRFLAPDPVQFQTDNPRSFNRYAYANNNPYRYTDPNGQSALSMLGKLIWKGGDIAATTAGIVEDFNTLTSSDSSPLDRLAAGASLISEMAPVSARDVKAAASILGDANKASTLKPGPFAARGAKPLLGGNPVAGRTRTNTELPGDLSTAKSIFRNQTRGQDVTQTTMPNGGVRRTAADGTQIRINLDGTARLDLPDRGDLPNGETIHIPPRF